MPKPARHSLTCIGCAALAILWLLVATQAWQNEPLGQPHLLRDLLESFDRPFEPLRGLMFPAGSWTIPPPTPPGWMPTSPWLISVPKLLVGSLSLAILSALASIGFALWARHAGEPAQFHAGPAAVALMIGLLALRLLGQL